MSRRAWLARSARRLAVGAMALSLLLLVVLLVFLIWISTGGGERWLQARLEDAVTGAMTEGGLRIGRLAVDARQGFVAGDLVLRDGAGHPVVRVEQITVDLRVDALWGGTVWLPAARLEGVRVDLEMERNGVLNLARLFGQTAPSPPSSEPWRGLPVDLRLDHVDLRGVTVTYSTPSGLAFALAGAHGRARFTSEGDRLTLSDLALTGQLASPGPLVAEVRGAVVYDGSDGLEVSRTELRVPHATATVQGVVTDDVDLSVVLERAHLKALDPLLGGIGLGGRWAGSALVTGSATQPEVSVDLHGEGDSRGAVSATAVADLRGETPTWTLSGTMGSVHVGDVLVALETEVVLDGRVEVAGEGLSWPDGLSATGRWRGGEQVFAGQPVDAVDVHFQLEQARLELLEATRLDGIVGELAVTGELYLLDGPMDLRVQGSVQRRRLAALGVSGFGTDGVLDARVRGDLRHLDEPIRAYGSVVYSPFRYDDTVAVQRLVVGFDAEVLEGDVDGTAKVTGLGLDASGVTGSTLRGDAVAFSVRGGRTTVDGQLVLSTVAYDPIATVDLVRVGLAVDQRASGRRIDAAVELRDWALIDRPGGALGTARVEIVDDALTFEAQLWDEGRSVLQTDGTYGLADGAVGVSSFAYAPTPRTTWRSLGPWSLQVVEGGMRGGRIALGSDLGLVSVQGDLGTVAPLDATVRIEGLQLDHVSELYPDRLDGLSGTLEVGARLLGDPADPDIDGSVDLDGFWFGDQVRWLDVAGTFSVDAGMLRPDLALGVAGEPVARLSGWVPVDAALSGPALDPRQQAALDLAVLPGSFERLSRLSPAAEEAGLPVGSVSALVSSRGPLADPTVRVAGVAEVAVPGLKRAARVEFDGSRQDTLLDFWGDLRTDFAQRGTVAGGGQTELGRVFAWLVEGKGPEPDLADLEVYLHDMVVAGVLLGVPARSLVAMADAKIVAGGEVVGGVTLTGSPVRPVVEGGVHWLDAELGGESLEAASLSLVNTPRGFELEGYVTFAKGGGLTVSGVVPVQIDLDEEVDGWSTGELALDISGDGIPIGVAAAFDPGVRRGEGLVVVEGTVSGTFTDPVPELHASIEDGAFTYTPLGLNFSAIELELDATRERVVLSELTLESQPTRRLRAGAGLDLDQNSSRPRIEATGVAVLSDWTPTEIGGQVQLRDGPWLVATDDQIVRVDGDLFLAGSWPELSVDGELEVVQGRVLLDAAAFLNVAPLQTSPSMTITRGEQARRQASVDEPPLYADFDVDVAVDLQRNVELDVALPFIDDLGALGAAVTRVDLNTRLGGDIDLALRGGEPTLVGEVELLDGKVGVLRSQFDLTEGTLFFTGGDVAEPNLDVHAEMQVTDASLEMDISGTPSRPVFNLRSDEYPDRTEQMTILLTGRAPDELTSDEGAGTAQALAGLLFNSLLGSESLGTLSIEPDNTVRLGVPVSNRVYATTRLRTTTDPTKNTLAVQVEWSLLRRLVLDTEVGDRTASADMYWELRF